MSANNWNVNVPPNETYRFERLGSCLQVMAWLWSFMIAINIGMRLYPDFLPDAWQPAKPGVPMTLTIASGIQGVVVVLLWISGEAFHRFAANPARDSDQLVRGYRLVGWSINFVFLAFIAGFLISALLPTMLAVSQTAR